MTKELNIQIETCDDCPYCQFSNYYEDYMCYELNKPIFAVTTQIQPDCRLKNLDN